MQEESYIVETTLWRMNDEAIKMELEIDIPRTDTVLIEMEF